MDVALLVAAQVDDFLMHSFLVESKQEELTGCRGELSLAQFKSQVEI